METSAVAFGRAWIQRDSIWVSVATSHSWVGILVGRGSWRWFSHTFSSFFELQYWMNLSDLPFEPLNSFFCDRASSPIELYVFGGYRYLLFCFNSVVKHQNLCPPLTWPPPDASKDLFVYNGAIGSCEAGSGMLPSTAVAKEDICHD